MDSKSDQTAVEIYSPLSVANALLFGMFKLMRVRTLYSLSRFLYAFSPMWIAQSLQQQWEVQDRSFL